MTSRYSVGVDVGGTFTDVLSLDLDSGAFSVVKVPTTTGNQSQGFMRGLAALGVPLSSIQSIVHGTTVGTNAMLERKGVVCGLITTAGFRDVLELGRRTRRSAYGMIGSFEALIPRELRIEVPERIDARGNVLMPLDEEAVRARPSRCADRRRRGGDWSSIFLHSYANPAHEQRAAEIARALWPNRLHLGRLRHPARGPRVRARHHGGGQRLRPADHGALPRPPAARVEARALPRRAADHAGQRRHDERQGRRATTPCRPSCRVRRRARSAAARIGQQSGHPNLIGCDMGGTSFDVTLIRAGEPALSAEKDIAYGVPIRVPMIDIHTIGAGGGSIARITKAGILQVGPDSAGANPGPICYGRGGTEPTVTDANLVLGQLDPAALPGVAGGVSIETVRAAIVDKIGRPARARCHPGGGRASSTVASDHLASAIRLVSIEKGYDPRDFALFPFGGAGPLHAVALARELGVPTVLVPRFPGLTSALGCILADVRHDFVRTLNRPLTSVDRGRSRSPVRRIAQSRAAP